MLPCVCTWGFAWMCTYPSSSFFKTPCFTHCFFLSLYFSLSSLLHLFVKFRFLAEPLLFAVTQTLSCIQKASQANTQAWIYWKRMEKRTRKSPLGVDMVRFFSFVVQSVLVDLCARIKGYYRISSYLGRLNATGIYTTVCSSEQKWG